MDDYPNGCNAVVAVLSYTGFDMEDAMILNKSSYERGFGHASVYKTKTVDLKEEASHSGGGKFRFSNVKKPKPDADGDGDNELIADTIGVDGLPQVGQWVSEGDPLYTYVDDLTGKEKIGRHKEMEKACVQHVRLLGPEPGAGKGKDEGLERLSVTLRIPRNPVIGDKFSSRHGQKGVMSILWPSVDMPFSESGISPDIIINPHAFPSRMTIGMLIESMAGKSGALHGKFQDATPFQFHENGDKLAVDHFGEQVRASEASTTKERVRLRRKPVKGLSGGDPPTKRLLAAEVGQGVVGGRPPEPPSYCRARWPIRTCARPHMPPPCTFAPTLSHFFRSAAAR
jgi:DNA-directed RNA polymerase I subunit RPA2